MKQAVNFILYMIALFILSSSIQGCSVNKDEKVEVVISAAASLSDALNEIKQSYALIHPNLELQLNIGSSGALQQQIEQGAPVDLFISAAAEQMNELIQKQLIMQEKQQVLVRNELVLIVPAGNASMGSLIELTNTNISKLAIGIPGSVPAGSYARMALMEAGIWEAVQHKTVQGKDVRQVLQYVETGNADAGFVYQTDALSSDKVNISMKVSLPDDASIDYAVGMLANTRNPVETEQLYHYLQGDEAARIFSKYGFTTAGSSQQ